MLAAGLDMYCTFRTRHKELEGSDPNVMAG